MRRKDFVLWVFVLAFIAVLLMAISASVKADIVGVTEPGETQYTSFVCNKQGMDLLRNAAPQGEEIADAGIQHVVKAGLCIFHPNKFTLELIAKDGAFIDWRGDTYDVWRAYLTDPAPVDEGLEVWVWEAVGDAT